MSDESAPKCNCTSAENKKQASGDADSTSVSRCCVKQRNWSLLHSKRFCDVCFIVGGKKIYAHKNILSTGSSIFETMFSEKWSQKADEIEVPDVEPAVFFSVLRFIYTDDEIQITADSVMSILYAAKKYAISSVENQCSSFLEDQLCLENACLLLSQARMFDQPQLIESCLKEIDKNPEGAFMCHGFTSLDLATLCSVVKRDTLRIDEVDLFKAVVRWSVAKCERKNLRVNGDNQKLVLEDAVLLIRYPLMTIKEFALEVVPSGLLSDADCLDIYAYFSGVPKTLPSFNGTPRLLKELFIVQRFLNTKKDNKWICTGSKDGIGFSCNHNVKLLGFGLYALYGSSEGKYEIIVKNEETKETLHQCSASCKQNGDSEVFQVLLEDSLALAANTKYCVITQTQVPHCYCGENGQERVKCDNTTEVIFHNISDEECARRTTVTWGQIPEILFR